MKRGPRSSRASVERTERMAALFRSGQTLAQVGEQVGLSRQRVWQLLRTSGITSADGGRCARLAVEGRRTDRMRAQREARVQAKHGMSLDEYSALIANGATLAYRQQRTNAHMRGIAFRLTLGQWWGVWQESGRWSERGIGAGRYCMSRIADAGGYEVGNVVIKTNVENGREGVAQWAGKSKPIRGVFLLYPGRARSWQAKVGRQCVGYFETAEEASAARRTYAAEHGIPLAPDGAVDQRAHRVLTQEAA